MGHALISTDACDTANAMALTKAKLGEGAKIVDLRRKAWDSYDLAYVVQGVDGKRKEVLVTNAALKRRLATMSQ